MITIIHGDNISASRKYFIEEKEKHPDSLVFDGEKVSLIDLAQIFDGGGLFNNSKTIFIEQFFSKKKKSKEKDELMSSFLNYAKDNNFVIWENKELERSILNTFKSADIKSFKIPQALFLFLDSIKAENSKQLISLFHKSLTAADVEMVFFMMIRQVRLLLSLMPSLRDHEMAKQSSSEDRRVATTPRDDNNVIDEVKRLAPWQINKLKNQANQFTSEQLISLYKKLFNLEINQKTGGLSTDLVSSIDFLLLKI